jgi:uncharacterized HhH-GPD family protein
MPRSAPKPTLPVTGNPEADQLLVDDPLARLLGMLLDQQVPMEWAFSAPLKLKERLGGSLDAAHIAALPLEQLEVIFKGPPALHRYPGSMAKRAQQLCQALVDGYGGSAEALWTGVDTGDELFRRLKALPGFGGEKSKIFMALLAKRFGITPAGWEGPAAPFSDSTKRSIADVESQESLLEVRAFKQAKKLEGKGKDDGPLPKGYSDVPTKPLRAPRVPKGLTTPDQT